VEDLIQEDAETPDVKCVVMRTVENHLGSHVLQCPAEGGPGLVIAGTTPTEVTEF
jgi:hypothetical protein